MIEILLANLVIALAAFIQASAGIGFAMVAVPLLALITLDFVPGPSLFVMLVLALVMTLGAWRDIDWQGLPTLLPSLAIGTMIGAFFLGALPDEITGPLFGSVVLLALLIGRFGLSARPSRLAFGLAGGMAGLMGTVAGIHGPALAVIYQRLEMRLARATIALIFVIGSVLSLVSLQQAGLFGQAELKSGAALLPGLLLGYGLARAIAGMITETAARRTMLWLASLSALLLIAKGLWAFTGQGRGLPWSG